MKKRIVSVMLVLAFALLALPMSVSADAGNTFDEWTAKVGSISAVDGGVFQINAFDAGQKAATTNVKHARLAVWNGSLPEGSISVTFDTASLVAGRGDGRENGTNDTGIIFGAKGIKDFVAFSSNNNMNNDKEGRGLEDTTQSYFLCFSIGSSKGSGKVTLKQINKGWSNGFSKSVPTSEFSSVWEAAKTAGKITVTIDFTEEGTLKVYMDGTHIPGFDRTDVVPYGDEVAVRASMGWHVPTKVLAADIKEPEVIEPEQPGTEGEGTEQPGTEQPGTEQPGTEGEGTEQPGTDNAGTDNTAGDKKDDAKKDNSALIWIIVAVVAVLAAAGIAVAIAKKKKK